jgi:hypothetical protein
MANETYKVDPDITVMTVNQLIDHVGTLKRCVTELSKAVRARAEINHDFTELGQLDAIDHVLRTLPV